MPIIPPIPQGLLALLLLLFGTGVGACQSPSTNRPESTTPAALQAAPCDETQRVQALLQSLIDLPDLQPYYPVEEVKNRGSLVLQAIDSLSGPLPLTKWDQEVEILSPAQIAERSITAYLEVTSLEIEDTVARVELRYQTQGVHLVAEFKREDCTWEPTQTRLVER